ELIAEIRKLSSGHVDAVRQEAMINEVRAHLDASIQARLELGQAPEIAEIEAVQSFGTARRFVNQILNQETSRSSRFLSVATFLLSVLAVLALCSSAFSPQEEPKTLAEFAVLLPLFPA